MNPGIPAPFVAMELLEGQTLGDVLEGASIGGTAGATAQVAGGVNLAAQSVN